MTEDSGPGSPDDERPDRPPTIDPAVLEVLRRSVRLRRDRLGRFWVGDELVTHPRVAAMLARGVDRGPEGALIVRWGAQWAYLEADDAPCFVESLAVRGQTVLGRLDDGRQLELDPVGLRETDGGGLLAWVPSACSGALLDARLSNAAAVALAEHCEPAGEGHVLVLGDRRWPIAPVRAVEP